VTDAGQDWDDPARVDRWVARDARRPVLQAARELAVALVGLDAEPAAVLELAGGAGTFLAEFLETFPAARGVWSDGSGEMERHARTTLSRFGDRVEYLIADMRDPGVERASADVVICARATHGVRPAELGPFYREVAGILRPGGWLVNLDHVVVDDPWGARYDQVTPRFYDQSEKPGPVRAKNRGSHTVESHLAALADAGLSEVDMPWRLLATVLFLARRPLVPVG
jgi:SAM-dependent methyltransferase